MSEVQGSSTSGNQAAREGYDYEAQGYRANTGVPRGNLPTTSYIPQYTLDGSYPIQEVVPNSQYAFTSGAYLNTTAARGRRRPSAAISTAISTNVPNAGGLKMGGEDYDGEYAVDSAADVPMMVKPKTLYQNPQTPMVLPSTYHPINRWSSFKASYLKEFLAEFLGTLMLVFIGQAMTCEVKLGGRTQEVQFNEAIQRLNATGTVSDSLLATVSTLKDIISSTSSGTFDDIPWGWGCGILLGYFCCGGSAISGGHMNPAVTLANYVFRGFPGKKVLVYMTGQMLGGFVGTLICFGLYKKCIEVLYPDWGNVEGVAGLFVTYPKPYLSTARQVVSELVNSAMLQAGIFCLCDPYTCLSSELFPIMLFILFFMLNGAFSFQTACAINQARDTAPRLALYAVGFHRELLWVRYAHYFWVPLIVPFIGALFGGLIYDICIYQGHESPVNWPAEVWKEKLSNAWWRHPNLGSIGSEESEYTYDDQVNEKEAAHKDTGMKGVSRGRTNESAGDAGLERGVGFKPVQRTRKALGSNIPTILEDTASTVSHDAASACVLLSSDENSV